MLRVVLSSILLACAVRADELPSFENLTVKLSATDGFAKSVPESARGGPGTDSPGSIDYRHMRLAMLLVRAYGVRYCDLEGPESMLDERYDVSAKLPPDTTEAQFQSMLQGLLAERFKLQVHRETKLSPVFALRVAESRALLREHSELVTAKFSEHGDVAPGGYSILTPGSHIAIDHGRGTVEAQNKEIAWLAHVLVGQLGVPVIDETALTGRYDFALRWRMAYPRLQPSAGMDNDLAESLEAQLGLKLERTMMPVESLVVDQVERIPSTN